MATNYPGGLDSLTNPSPGGALTSPSHAGQHTDANDAIEAIETELGTNPSGSAATVKARLDAIEAGIATSGTVAPEGVITAPPLSRYQQVSGAATATGAMEWIKATGTGNTGWVPEGALADTGLRDIAGATMQNGWVIGYGQHTIRRVGSVVDYYALVDNTSATDDHFYLIPSGFRPLISARPVGWSPIDVSRKCAVEIPSSGTACIRAYNTYPAGTYMYVFATWTTRDAWPSSLPGIA